MASVSDDHQRQYLHDALVKLTRKDPQKAQILLLRYFAGFSLDQIASAIEASPETVETEWRFIRAWLRRELKARNTARADSKPTTRRRSTPV